MQKTIANYEKEIAKKPKEAMDRLYKSLDIDLQEIMYYQEKKSIAQLESKIDFETSLLLYRSLSPIQWSKTTLAERITITLILEQITKRM